RVLDGEPRCAAAAGQELVVDFALQADRDLVLLVRDGDRALHAELLEQPLGVLLHRRAHSVVDMDAPARIEMRHRTPRTIGARRTLGTFAALASSTAAFAAAARA